MTLFDQLLQPLLSVPLSADQLQQLGLYLELLLKWNARISLTSLRNPEQILRRHFGESLFAGEQLHLEASSTLIDMGSGAGFPGLPIKILKPELEVTLIESQHKKVAFLREVIRTLGLKTVSVHAGRAEGFALKSDVVTLRAVERFESALPLAGSLLNPGGTVALLIGRSQAEVARKLLPGFCWREPVDLPESRERILLAGSPETS